VGAVEVARPFSHPQKVRRAVVELAREAVPARQSLLVSQDQRFVRCIEVDLVKGGIRAQVDPTCRHEPQGPIDLSRNRLVPLPLLAPGDEFLVPDVDLGEIGEATLR
jgi:hypothetical protein